MAAGSAKHDWGDFRAAAKAGAIILALLTCYFSLGGCIYAPDGYAGGGYGRPPYEQREHYHEGYYRGGYGRGGYGYSY